MISFRNHLLTLIAVFLALAVGVVLGSGPLQATAQRQTSGIDASQGSGSLGSDSQGAEQSRYGEQFAAAVAPRLVQDALKDREIVVLCFPGASKPLVDALESAVSDAGGAVTGTWQILPGAVSPGAKTLVDTLGSQLAESLPKEVVQADATTYERLGQLLALPLATTNETGSGPWARDASVRAALAGADLIEGPDSVQRKAPLVLVVLGDKSSDEAATTIQAGLVTGISRAARGTVLVGDAAAGPVQLAKLRTELRDVASVDSVDSPMGRTAAVLALSRSLKTPGGAFGEFGSDGPVPLG